MRKLILASLSVLLAVSGCKKKDKDPTSTWTVNGETFSINEYKIVQNKNGSFFEPMSNNYGNNFCFGNSVANLPNDSFIISCGDRDPACVCLQIEYNAKFYYPHGRTKMNTIIENGRPVYKIDSMLLYNYYTDTDMIFVSGIFKVPEPH